ncbi:hypothetical protein [Dyadobacter bucti]|jgi:hypothetical protein|uniref:hypothetical protein n=1 Tax=Dyadobacter bucti TaxID=2572203 RepID=UPI003F6EAC6B
MKNIRLLIEETLKKQELIASSIEDWRSNLESSSDARNLLFHVRPEQLNSSEIVNLIADSLQLLDPQELIDQFDLLDILALYKLTLTNNKYNIEFFKDYILYKINVLDETKDAVQELTEYVNLIEIKLDELKNILKSLTVE